MGGNIGWDSDDPRGEDPRGSFDSIKLVDLAVKVLIKLLRKYNFNPVFIVKAIRARTNAESAAIMNELFGDGPTVCQEALDEVRKACCYSAELYEELNRAYGGVHRRMNLIKQDGKHVFAASNLLERLSIRVDDGLYTVDKNMIPYQCGRYFPEAFDRVITVLALSFAEEELERRSCPCATAVPWPIVSDAGFPGRN